MKVINKKNIVCAILFVACHSNVIAEKITGWNFAWSGDHKEELIYGKNITGYNKLNKADKVLTWRGTTNINVNGVYNAMRKNSTDSDSVWPNALVVGGTIRSRIPRGTTDNLIKTTTSSIKVAEVVNGDHTHALSRHFLWVRSAYAEVDLAALLGISFNNKHSLKFGMFPYQLDPQGIALGDAYAVAPNGSFMGDIDSGDVDQFACGVLLSDEIVKDVLTSDLYIALLQNKSSTLGDTNARVLGHLYDRFKEPARNFGSFNYVVAGKLVWQPLKKTRAGSLKIVPFGLFNHEMEQKVELIGDARSKLGTCGIGLDYDIDNFEASFETAVNFGNQHVKGIDRNQIVFQNTNGLLGAFNSHVFIGDIADKNLLPYVPKSENQDFVYNSLQAARNNGQLIGVSLEDGSSLFNSPKRYRDEYKNMYKGWMAVFDAGYWFCERQLRIAVMAAIASGDENPNAVLQDGDYRGFQPLQELYAGKRVQSSFFLGGMGRPRRPLSVATDAQAPDRFLKDAPTVGGFSNLRIVGGSLLWISSCPQKRPFKVNPNVMAFWQDYATGGARSYLGTEVNIFLSTNVFDTLEVFGVFALFAPGSHFTDRKDQALLTLDQQELADKQDSTGFTAERIPGISDNLAYSLNCGVKITF